MKNAWKAFWMCQSMFCALPAPQVWEEKARDKILLFLPLVGLEIGVFWVFSVYLCRLVSFPAPVVGLVMAVCPYLLTGFLHLDGFMDVTDAVRSWRDPERRREILKDSHVGSFSVIGVVLVLLMQLVFCIVAAPEKNCGILLLIPVISRCGSALAVTVLPPMQTSRYAGRKKKVSHILLLCAEALVALTAGFFFFGRLGFALLGGMAGYALALLRSVRSLRGMNGDIAGYALTLGELCALAVYALI